jgi:Trypsin-like peptidase domain
MTFDPLAATGLVFRGLGPTATFVGSGFLFRNGVSVITAAHVVDGLNPTNASFVLPHTLPLEYHELRAIQTCPSADLAILALKSPSSAPPFSNHVSNYSVGEDFMAYGFPEDIMADSPNIQTPRLFRGHYQRYFYHHSKLGYGYNAAEASIPFPPGLSGGPVFRPSAHAMVTGLATENFRSSSILESEEEERMERDGSRSSSMIKYQQVIQYGVTLLLDSHKEWLAERIPTASEEPAA